MEPDTPTTPQTSSDGSSEITTSVIGNPELDNGSECDWRDTSDDNRPVFFMGDEEITRYPTNSAYGSHKNLDGQKIRVGICAMAKKAHSKPMKEILARLERFEHLQLEVFEEAMIVDSPVEEWPVVDALIAFFSHGFPLQKAIQYKNLHKPFVVNDLEAQYAIKDRREVYKILVREGIPLPRYAVMNRDEDEKGDFEENEDAIEVNGTSFQRPFVEKPVNAEDHNIYIYFPVSAGGGCQRLFRKVGSRSSVYSTISRVRKAGSYIYEDFMPTDGTDVKVYTVGPDYVHAEARKSPALDGKVERDKDGKEVRYPVILSATEKMIARKICLAFKQNVCGFDLLRTGGKSYVCDVNGFSFVKNSTKYYDDCANVMGTMIVRALAPQLHIQNVALVLGAAPEDIPVVPTTSGSMMELRCVIAVIRHGDRTPKQKMKMEVKHKKFFELFEKHNGYKKGHLKLKKPKQLQEVLDIARDLLNESGHDPNPEVLEKKAKLRQLKLVLEMYEFSGINRKIQLKYQPYGRPATSSDDEYPKEPSLVLILKWGGELTPAGKYQAEDLGKAFRTLYPGGQGEFETPGLGFLRLHSTFRHDLKIYASDEGRVQMTAAAFTKGLLALEGELTPILVSMVKSANTNGLLDKEGETSKYQHVVKERLMEILNQDAEFTEEDVEKLAPTKNKSLLKAIEFIKNPKKMCDSVYEMVQEITAKIRSLKLELKSRDLKLYHGESWELLIRRWAKLEKDFKSKTGDYDISKIPDIYDCIKYDLQHNQKTLQFSRAEELFLYSKALADIVIPQEYGITVEEKLHISQSICTPLMRKIHSDLHQGCLETDEESTRLNSKYSKGVSSPERFVRTRLYFTSESHIHSLLNMLRFGGLCEEVKDEQWKKAMDFLSTTPELNYMTQINIMMFEDPSKEADSPEKFHVELHFSPGAYTNSDKNVVNPASSGYRTSFLVRQGKKSLDGKHKDVDIKSRNDEVVIADVIKETITEETLSEDSNTPCTLENVEEEKTVGDSTENITNVDEKAANKSNKGSDDDIGKVASQSGEKTVSFDDSKKTVEFKIDNEIIASVDNAIVEGNSTVMSNEKDIPMEIPDVSVVETETVSKTDMTVSADNNAGAKTVQVTTIAQSDKDIVAIENDAVNEISTSSVDELLNVTVTEESVINDSVGLQCNLSETEGSSNNVAKENENQKNQIEEKTATEVKNNGEQAVVKKPKKFSVVVTKPEEQVASSSSAERPKDLAAAAKPVKAKDMDSSSHDEVIFDEVFEEKLSDDEHSKTITNESSLIVQSCKQIPQPKSPDPDIPEWDWDDTASEQKPGSDTTIKPSDSMEKPVTHISKSDSSMSKPILIQVPSVTKVRDRSGSFDDSVKSFEEKRSRSLEDHESREILSMLEKHYCTIHLPIKDSHHSFSSLLYLNPEAFKETLAPPDHIRLASYSSPTLVEFLNPDSERTSLQQQLQRRPQSGSYFTGAFDGFNMVPSLKPLETLHNNLTMKDLDAFLSRATRTKFFTPVSSPMYGQTPITSPRCPDLNKPKAASGPSLPSSSNSSAGPSSPTSACTPIDFLTSGNFYMIDTTKSDQQLALVDQTDQEVFKSSATNQKSDSGNVTLNKPMKSGTQSMKHADSLPSTSGVQTHPSAFKTVTRTNSTNKQSMFVISQVKEDSLPGKNPGESTDKSKTVIENENKAKTGNQTEGDSVAKVTKDKTEGQKS